jgi:hypothetical protein
MKVKTVCYCCVRFVRIIFVEIISRLKVDVKRE